MSTNIDDLPISSQANENISFSINDSNIKLDNQLASLQEQRQNEIRIDNVQINNNETQQTINNSLDENINNFVTSIQQASADGVLSLPSRDIPQNQTHLTQDNEANTDFIPNSDVNNYIKNEESTQEIIDKNKYKQDSVDFMNYIYNEIHIPLLLCVLYFLFNLPIINKTIFKLLPFFFKKDVTLNLFGHMFKSVCFSSVFFIIFYGLKYISI